MQSQSKHKLVSSGLDYDITCPAVLTKISFLMGREVREANAGIKKAQELNKSHMAL